MGCRPAKTTEREMRRQQSSAKTSHAPRDSSRQKPARESTLPQPPQTFNIRKRKPRKSMIPHRPETFKVSKASTREETQASQKECPVPSNSLPQPVSPATNEPPNIIEMAEEKKGPTFLQLPPKEQRAVLRANAERNRQQAETADKIETDDSPKNAPRESSQPKEVSNYRPPHMRPKEKEKDTVSMPPLSYSPR